VTLIMDFDLVLKNFNWTILIEPNALGLWYLQDINASRGDLCYGTKIWPSDLGLRLDLVLKYFNLNDCKSGH
jgi:hypothetical protein